MKAFGCVGMVLLVVVLCAISLVIGAAMIATIGAWFLSTPWIDGWHAAWSNPLKLILVWFFVIPFFVGSGSSRSN